MLLLCGQGSFDDGCVRQIINTLTHELNISNDSLASWNEKTKQFVRSALKLLRVMKKYTHDVVAQFMSHFILGDQEIRYATRTVPQVYQMKDQWVNIFERCHFSL